jgi:hypothetical protein
MNDNMVLVRIAVGMDADGCWCAVGDHHSTDDAKTVFLHEHAPVKVQQVYFVEALVPVPLPVGVIEGWIVEALQDDASQAIEHV